MLQIDREDVAKTLAARSQVIQKYATSQADSTSSAQVTNVFQVRVKTQFMQF